MNNYVMFVEIDISNITLILIELQYGSGEAFKTLSMNGNVQDTFLYYPGNVTAVF